MKKNLIISLLFIIAVGCDDDESDALDIAVKTSISNNPIVNLSIRLKNNNVSSSDSLILDIRLTNNNKSTQKLIFEGPSSLTFGPWATSGEVLDGNGNSVLMHQNKQILESQVYSPENLEEHYYFLKSGESIHTECPLARIVSFKDYQKEHTPFG